MSSQPLSHKDFRFVLQQEFLSRCRRNPKYSIRSFARFLETDFSTLAKIMNGKRPLGRRSVVRFGERLGIAPEGLAPYLGKAKRDGADEATPTAGADYALIAADTFRIIAEWQHYAILELMRLDHFRPDVKAIARTLGISQAEAAIAVERLARCGMLEIAADGTWRDRTEGRSTNIASPADSSAAQRLLQRQVLEGAISALENIPPAHRDQSSMTMAIDRARLPEARAMIKDFRRQIAAFLSRGTRRDDVYHLSVSLYPVTTLYEGDKT